MKWRLRRRAEQSPVTEQRLPIPGNPEPIDKFEGERRTVENADLRQDVRLKRRYANGALFAIGSQLLVADGVFVVYGWQNHWQLAPEVILGWLSATVVEVIGVVLVITRYLFPARGN